MNKLFVPFELAVKLKENGFNELCFGKFLIPEVPENRFRYNTEGEPKNYNDGSYGRFISAPLYQQVVDWLRDEQYINIEISYDYMTFDVAIYNFKKSTHVKLISSLSGNSPYCFTDYYQALTEAIKEALK